MNDLRLHLDMAKTYTNAVSSRETDKMPRKWRSVYPRKMVNFGPLEHEQRCFFISEVRKPLTLSYDMPYFNSWRCEIMFGPRFRRKVWANDLVTSYWSSGQSDGSCLCEPWNNYGRNGELESPHLTHAKWFMRTPASAILQAQLAPSCPVPTVAREATTHSYEQKERRWSSK